MLKASLVATLAFMGLLLCAGVTSHAATQAGIETTLRCENLGPNNDLCLSADLAQVTASALSTGSSSQIKMVTTEELTGGAVDIDNAFASSTVLEDATEVTERNETPQALALTQAIKTQNQIRLVEDYMKSFSSSGFSGRVSESGRR